jgi:hypothetical protein
MCSRSIPANGAAAIFFRRLALNEVGDGGRSPQEPEEVPSDTFPIHRATPTNTQSTSVADDPVCQRVKVDDVVLPVELYLDSVRRFDVESGSLIT